LPYGIDIYVTVVVTGTIPDAGTSMIGRMQLVPHHLVVRVFRNEKFLFRANDGIINNIIILTMILIISDHREPGGKASASSDSSIQMYQRNSCRRTLLHAECTQPNFDTVSGTVLVCYRDFVYNVMLLPSFSFLHIFL